MSGDCCVFEFLQRSVDRKHLVCLQSETSVFKFLQRSVHGTWDWRGWNFASGGIGSANFFLPLFFCTVHNGFFFCQLRYILTHSVQHVDLTFRPPGYIIEHIATGCATCADLRIAEFILKDGKLFTYRIPFDRIPSNMNLRTFARNFSNIEFFLKILPLKDDE